MVKTWSDVIKAYFMFAKFREGTEEEARSGYLAFSFKNSERGLSKKKWKA